MDGRRKSGRKGKKEIKWKDGMIRKSRRKGKRKEEADER